MDVVLALQELGVTEALLDTETARKLDEDGYASIPGVIPRETVNSFRTRLAELHTLEGELAGTEVGTEEGIDRLSDLVNKGTAFEIGYTHPLVLAFAHHVLGDFKLSSLSSRSVPPGEGHQELHPDWEGPAPVNGDYQVFNTIWMLDDFTPQNGATRVIPGSHLLGQSPSAVMADLTAPHPQEELILGTAGTLVVFNGHVWHGGTKNRSTRPRRAVNAYFTRRTNQQQLDQAAFVRPETLARTGPAARFILDV
ncbi:phytanoyl-CoA dioxygenase family protein [Kitasatospora acidiphila]|uniref:Phytanoyl-CoA dioxygenase family protein n=1 Tax=Kitasatospora acidiphila TaxID=2567942 RepID=A0A540VZ04_9ACTN|nr:phytanoyl-CoA dioxygenase family protein [Kitasatospora acidiphila]TQF01961.1 phytanoyl-CoA dioxygenase family protein [Kitasatospora acidiphila]